MPGLGRFHARPKGRGPADLLRKLRAFLVAGVVVSLPVAITFYLLYLIFRVLDGFMADLTSRAVGFAVPGLGLAAMAVLLTMIGAVTTRLLGKRLVSWFEGILGALPVVRSVYPTVKQLIGVFVAKEGAEFRRVALVEYPCPGVFSLGLITGGVAAPGSLSGDDLLTIFVPDTPNPTNGRFILVPRHRVRYLKMSVEQGLTMIISAGTTGPANLQEYQEA